MKFYELPEQVQSIAAELLAKRLNDEVFIDEKNRTKQKQLLKPSGRRFLNYTTINYLSLPSSKWSVLKCCNAWS